MVSGLELRMNRILRNGRMLCIPMDHGISDGPVRGLEKPAEVIYSCGATCIVINKGVIKSLPKAPNTGILMHISGSTSLSTSPNRKMMTGTVEEAVRMGADGVSIHINIGGREEPEMLQQLGHVSEQCQRWGMPLLAMMYPRGENISNPHDPAVVAHAARIGAECGADIIKTLYTGDVDSFTRVVESIPVPVVVAGGPRAKTEMDILSMTYGAIKAGAIGVTYGRNIFAHENPAAITKSLGRIIFDEATAEEAFDG